MKELLDGKYAPITFNIGFIEASLDVTAKYLKHVLEINATVRSTPQSGHLPELFQLLEPLTFPPTRQLIVQTDSHWTALFNNNTSGGEISTDVDRTTEKISCRGLVIDNFPNTLVGAYSKKRGVYGAIGFELFVPDSHEWRHCERAVLAMNDGGRWVFKESGNPQSFELVETYAAKRIKDRISSELLEHYCKALGIRLFDQEFYGQDAIILDVDKKMPPGYPSMTLSQARYEIGYE